MGGCGGGGGTDAAAAAADDNAGAIFAVVTQVFVAGIDELEVVPCFKSGIHPMIIRLIERGCIIPEGLGGKISLVGGQADLHAPVAAGQQVKGAYETADAAVFVGACGIVHRCGAVGGMPDDTIICFQSATGPGPAHSDVPEFYGMVVIEKGLVCRLFDSSPDLAADLRQDEQTEVLILQ